MLTTNCDYVILKLLGKDKQNEIITKIVRNYLKKYADEFGFRINNVEVIKEHIYKIIIKIAVSDVKEKTYDIKMPNGKILKIDLKEIKKEYTEYINEIKEILEYIEEIKIKPLYD